MDSTKALRQERGPWREVGEPLKPQDGRLKRSVFHLIRVHLLETSLNWTICQGKALSPAMLYGNDCHGTQFLFSVHTSRRSCRAQVSFAFEAYAGFGCLKIYQLHSPCLFPAVTISLMLSLHIYYQFPSQQTELFPKPASL